MAKQNTVNLIAKVDPVKKQRFIDIAKHNNTTASQLLRIWMDDYLSKNSHLQFDLGK